MIENAIFVLYIKWKKNLRNEFHEKQYTVINVGSFPQMRYRTKIPHKAVI